MITVICATHRPQNQTFKVVEKYMEVLKELGEVPVLFDLGELPDRFLTTNSFGEPNHGLDDIINEKIIPAGMLVVVAPEYNGSYPGLFKAFIDVANPGIWKGKKVALAGVATGRAGNQRGMDHLTDVLHYLRAEVFSLKIPISRLNTLLNESGEVRDEGTVGAIRQQMEEFLKF